MSGIPAIGDVVREWRQYRQISLTEFSQQAKLTKGYISELEHNKIDNPKPDKLERMAAALGISALDIVSRRMPSDNSGAGTTSSLQQSAVGQPTQKVSSPSTRLNTPLPTPPKEILMHRLAMLKEKVEAAEKNLRDTREEVLEIEALAVNIFGEEESHAPTPSTGSV
jgi:transcriptional regulator with XRE-family HTH domain